MLAPRYYYISLDKLEFIDGGYSLVNQDLIGKETHGQS